LARDLSLGFVDLAVLVKNGNMAKSEGFKGIEALLAAKIMTRTKDAVNTKARRPAEYKLNLNGFENETVSNSKPRWFQK